MNEEIEHLADVGRFQVCIDGQLGFVEYRRRGDRIELLHTEVAEALNGRGIAGKLVRATLDHARANGLKVVALCDYASAYMRRHPDTHDLLA